MKQKKKEGKFTRKLGLRQGMPLSPLLSNFFLRDFDRAIEKKEIPAIRYVDDLLIFAQTKEELGSYEEYLNVLIDQLGLDFSSGSKRKEYNSVEHIEFLGFQLKRNDSKEKKTIPKLSSDRMKKIKSDFLVKSKWNKCKTLYDLQFSIEKSIKGYNSCYGDGKAYNFCDLLEKLKEARRAIILKRGYDVLGEGIMKQVKSDFKKKKFLGFDI